MSHTLCNHAVYKDGKVYASMKCNNDTEPFEETEMELDDFIHYLTCDIEMTTTPKTKLEKAIARADRLWGYPIEDYEWEDGKLKYYIIKYKTRTEKKTPEEYSEWHKHWKSGYKAIIKRALGV